MEGDVTLQVLPVILADTAYGGYLVLVRAQASPCIFRFYPRANTRRQITQDIGHPRIPPNVVNFVISARRRCRHVRFVPTFRPAS